MRGWRKECCALCTCDDVLLLKNNYTHCNAGMTFSLSYEQVASYDAPITCCALKLFFEQCGQPECT